MPQKPDGTIDDETRYTLKKLGAWLKNNGEGIFSSRPYSIYRDGKTELVSGSFKEGKAAWQSMDYRFTRKDSAIYAYMMRTGGDEKAVIYSLGRLYENEIKSVDVSGRPTVFEQKGCALLVRIPGGLNKGMPICIKAMVDK